jgi:subtilisin family serine protease
MWGEQGAPFEAGIQVYSGTTLLSESQFYSTATTSTYVDSFVVVNTDTVWFNLSADAAHPFNNRPQIRMRVKSPPAGYKVVLKSTATSGTVHYWNVTELTSDVGNWGMPFSTFSNSGVTMTNGNKTHGIGMPSCSYSSISVAAHSAEFRIFNGTLFGGQEAGFSSFGPLLNDTLKPDVSGPGVSVVSSISSYTDNNFTQVTSVPFNGRDYPFAAFSGTSMSSPVVAGVVALIWDANPYLSSQQVKDIIKQTARLDQYTGAIPPHSSKWGWGKVNAHAAIVLALNTTGVEKLKEEPKWTVFPNPTSGEVTISNLAGDVQSIQVFDYSGKLQDIKVIGSVMNFSQLASGIYIVRIIRDNKVEQRKLIKQ